MKKNTKTELTQDQKLDLILKHTSGLTEDVHGLQIGFTAMSKEITTMKKDIVEIKKEQAEMKKEQKLMKQDIKELKGQMDVVAREQAYMRSDVNDLKSGVGKLREAVRIFHKVDILHDLGL